MNEELNNTNPLSSWIRPGLAIIFGVVLAIMLISAFTVAVAAGNWQVAVGLLVVAAVPPFWYFNIRSGDKAVEKMLGMFQLGTSAASQGPQGVVPPATPSEGVSPPLPPPAAPPAAPVVEAPPEPFDVQAFHSMVVAAVSPSYGEVNPATTFYEAMDKGRATACEDISQAQDYWDYLSSLAADAFAYIWGYSYADALQNIAAPGCPKCPSCGEGCGSHQNIDSKARHMGMQFYTVLLDLRRILRQRADLEQLAAERIDWKSKLGPQNQTLFGLGALASELLKYR